MLLSSFDDLPISQLPNKCSSLLKWDHSSQFLTYIRLQFLLETCFWRALSSISTNVIWKTRTPDNADTDTDNMLTLTLTVMMSSVFCALLFSLGIKQCIPIWNNYGYMRASTYRFFNFCNQ